jgi:hypothetical protein
MLPFLLGSAVIVAPRGNLALLAAIGAVKGAGECGKTLLIMPGLNNRVQTPLDHEHDPCPVGMTAGFKLHS